MSKYALDPYGIDMYLYAVEDSILRQAHSKRSMSRITTLVDAESTKVYNKTNEKKGDNAMKKSEIISANYKKLTNKMTDLYHSVLNSDGRIQYSVYIWSDGEIEILEDVQGGNSFLQARDYESRELFPVCTISQPYFDPWDFTDHSEPEDESERDTERQEIVSWLIDEYPTQAEAILDGVIEDAEQDEQFE